MEENEFVIEENGKNFVFTSQGDAIACEKCHFRTKENVCLRNTKKPSCYASGRADKTSGYWVPEKEGSIPVDGSTDIGCCVSVMVNSSGHLVITSGLGGVISNQIVLTKEATKKLKKYIAQKNKEKGILK